MATWAPLLWALAAALLGAGLELSERPGLVSASRVLRAHPVTSALSLGSWALAAVDPGSVPALSSTSRPRCSGRRAR